MMHRFFILCWMILINYGLAGCGTPEEAATPQANPTPEGTTLPPTAISTEEGVQREWMNQTQAALAEHLGLEQSAITVTSLTEQQWSSAALGCPAPNIRYAQQITPGYKIIAEVNGQTYTIHTDQTSTMVLCENGEPVDLNTPSSGSEPTPNKELPAMTTTQELIANHATTFNVPTAEISVVSEEEVTWSSSALGCPQKDQMYLTVLTPGFRVILEHKGSQYAYHAGRNQEFFLCSRPEQPVDNAK